MDRPDKRQDCKNEECIYYLSAYRGCVLPDSCIYWPEDELDAEADGNIGYD